MQRTYGDGHVSHRFAEEDLSVFRRPTQLTAAWFNSVQEEIISVISAAGITLDVSQEDQLLQALNVLYGSASETTPGVLALASSAETVTGTNTTKAVHPAGVLAAINSAINSLVNGAGTALNQLNELASALGNDPNFSTTVLTLIASKLTTSVFNDFLANPLRTAALSQSDLSTSLVTTAWAKFGFSYYLGFNTTTRMASSYFVFPVWLGGMILQWGHVRDGAENNDVFTSSFPIPFPTSCNFCALFGSAGFVGGLSSPSTEGAEVTDFSNTTFTVVSAWTGGTFGSITHHASYPALAWWAVGR